MDQHILFSCAWASITVLGKTDNPPSVEIDGSDIFTETIPVKWPTADVIIEYIEKDLDNKYCFVIVHDRDYTQVEAVYDVFNGEWISIDKFNEEHTFNADEYMNRSKFLHNK